MDCHTSFSSYNSQISDFSENIIRNHIPFIKKKSRRKCEVLEPLLIVNFINRILTNGVFLKGAHKR